MTKPDDDFEIVRGSVNVFRDFDYPYADAPRTTALLATEIIGILDDERLSTRKIVDAAGRVRLAQPTHHSL